MTALVFTALAVLLVAGPLAVALTAHHRQETPMPRHTAQSIGIAPPPDFEPPPMALQPAGPAWDPPSFEDIGDRGTCTTRGRHEHCWWQIVDRDGEQVKLGIVLQVSPSGVVMLSEGSTEEILTAAGFARSES